MTSTVAAPISTGLPAIPPPRPLTAGRPSRRGSPAARPRDRCSGAGWPWRWPARAGGAGGAARAGARGRRGGGGRGGRGGGRRGRGGRGLRRGGIPGRGGGQRRGGVGGRGGRRRTGRDGAGLRRGRGPVLRLLVVLGLGLGRLGVDLAHLQTER